MCVPNVVPCVVGGCVRMEAASASTQPLIICLRRSCFARRRVCDGQRRRTDIARCQRRRRSRSGCAFRGSADADPQGVLETGAASPVNTLSRAGGIGRGRRQPKMRSADCGLRQRSRCPIQPSLAAKAPPVASRRCYAKRLPRATGLGAGRLTRWYPGSARVGAADLRAGVIRRWVVRMAPPPDRDHPGAFDQSSSHPKHWPGPEASSVPPRTNVPSGLGGAAPAGDTSRMVRQGSRP